MYETGNIGSSSSYGIEASLDGSLNEKFDWEIGYIYQKIDDDLDNTNAAGVQINTKEYEKRNPQHQIKLKFDYHNAPWEANTVAYYASSTKHTKEITGTGTIPFDNVPGYVGLNARIAYTFENDITLALSAMNGQSSSTETSATPDIERRVFLSLTKKF